MNDNSAAAHTTVSYATLGAKPDPKPKPPKPKDDDPDERPYDESHKPA